jgi:hypothetical protein
MAKTRLGRENFDAWCRQHGEDPMDALHEESFHGLIAYEELLKQKHGWRAVHTYLESPCGKKAKRLTQKIDVNHWLIWCRVRDSNPRPSVYKTG